MNNDQRAVAVPSDTNATLPESVREPVVQSIRTTKIRTQHRERVAVVYVRQSTPQQVINHQESGMRQYDLAAHAMALGWSQQRVLVIDEDQGQSGRGAEHRAGFQRLLAEVTLEHVGLILGLEMSRLARSSKDWHHLLELCALFGTLLADQDGVYDPTDSNDRLLLGLKGSLRKQRELEDEWRRFSQATPRQLSTEERQRITALSQNVKALWNAAETTNVDRKEIVRCLVDHVVVHVNRNSEHVDVTIHWQEDFVSQHELLRPVRSYQQLAAVGQLRQRVIELHHAGNTTEQIAKRLNQEGYSPPQRCNPFSKEQVWRLLKHYGLTKKLDPVQLAPQEWRLPRLAKHLGVPIKRLRYWARKGWLHVRRTPTQGLWIVWADADEIERLRRLTARSKHGVCGQRRIPCGGRQSPIYAQGDVQIVSRCRKNL